MNNRIELTKTDLMEPKSTSLAEHALDLMKEHKTELVVAAAAGLTMAAFGGISILAKKGLIEFGTTNSEKGAAGLLDKSLAKADLPSSPLELSGKFQAVTPPLQGLEAERELLERDAIDHANRSIKMYRAEPAPSPNTVKSLIAAKERGVNVQVILDENSLEKNPSFQAPFNALHDAGVDVRAATDPVGGSHIDTLTTERDLVHFKRPLFGDDGEVNFGKLEPNAEAKLTLAVSPGIRAIYDQHFAELWSAASKAASTAAAYR